MKHFDPSRHLGSEEEIAAYITAILQESYEPGVLAAALDDAAHALSQPNEHSVAATSKEGALLLAEWQRLCRAERISAGVIANARDLDALLLAIDEGLEAAERARSALKDLRAYAVRAAQRSAKG